MQYGNVPVPSHQSCYTSLTIPVLFPPCCWLLLLQYGMEFAAQHILPLLTPLLTVQQLTNAQFARFLKLIMDILT